MKDISLSNPSLRVSLFANENEKSKTESTFQAMMWTMFIFIVSATQLHAQTADATSRTTR